jgi:alcohol dehydrogenase class IV
VQFNARQAEARELYHQLAIQAGLAGDATSATKSIAVLLEFFDAYRQTAGLPRSLEELNIPSPGLETLAEEAAGQWTARFNPRPVEAADFVELYRAVLVSRQTVENSR